MKNKIKLLIGIVAVALLPFASQAADYGISKTFWNFNGTWTNSPTVVTQLLAAADCTQITDFSLQVVAKATNGGAVAAGSFDIVWDVSADGSNFPTGITNALPGSVGWFSVPVYSNAITTAWATNITVNAIGYWRIRAITNNANMNYTSIVVRAYAKPKRTNRDY
jgi:hypothetical protein